VLLLSRSGVVTLLFVAGFPAAFCVTGHHLGVAAGVGRLVRGRSRQVAAWMTNKLWPGCELVARTPGAQSIGALSRALVAAADVSGPRANSTRRLLRWLLRVARIPQIVTATGFLELIRSDPAEARTALATKGAERLDALAETHRARTLLIMSLVPVVLAATRRFWLSWIGLG